MNVYQTDKDGFFVGVVKADVSPLEPGIYDEFGVLLSPAKYLIPAGAVTVAPPAVGANQAAKFAAGAWSLVPDFRGTKYWTADHKELEIKERGVTVPAGTFAANPPKTQAELDAETNALAMRNLSVIDLKSIRSIREYIAAKADAPAILKTYDSDAAIERAKIKP